MKHLNKLITVVVLLVGLLSQAQDANNSWSLSFGANAVDTRVSAASNIKDQFSNYFNTKDNWNFLPSLSYLNVTKYVGDNFSFGVTGSINKMSKFVNSKTVDGTYPVVNPGDYNYYECTPLTGFLDEVSGVDLIYGTTGYYIDLPDSSGINFELDSEKFKMEYIYYVGDRS